MGLCCSRTTRPPSETPTPTECATKMFGDRDPPPIRATHTASGVQWAWSGTVHGVHIRITTKGRGPIVEAPLYKERARWAPVPSDEEPPADAKVDAKADTEEVYLVIEAMAANGTPHPLRPFVPTEGAIGSRTTGAGIPPTEGTLATYHCSSFHHQPDVDKHGVCGVCLHKSMITHIWKMIQTLTKDASFQSAPTKGDSSSGVALAPDAPAVGNGGKEQELAPRASV
jgi:hypothetical protein